MTKEEAKETLLQHCDKVMKRANRFSFFTDRRRDITLDITRILEPWEKDANLALPAKLNFPDHSIGFTIDSNGLTLGNSLVKWNEVALTAIAKHFIQLGMRRYKTEYYFICCLINGDIIERELGNIDKYSNLLGHFIELYKNADKPTVYE